MATPLDFEVYGNNAAALFTLKIFRGEGMALLGMNWKVGPPPLNFVGFAIEYKEPNGSQFFAVTNRLRFAVNEGSTDPNMRSSRLSPIQKFRWVHFPFHPGLVGLYTYRVSPVFMDSTGVLSYGDQQEASIALDNETYPGLLNIGFTRGFVTSQAFEDRFSDGNKAHALLPVAKTDDHLTFISQNPQAATAYAWMGLKSRQLILNLLDAAIADTTAEVVVAAYDLDLKEIVDKLKQLGKRLRIIIDNSDPKKGHGKPGSWEEKAENRLVISAGRDQVQRQKAEGLQHNKYIAVRGNVQQAIGGSTNYSWRGFYVQNNNAVQVSGAKRVDMFFAAFESLWANKEKSGTFNSSPSANWQDLGFPWISGKITFSPHNAENACLGSIADDIKSTSSSLLYSLAFLYQTTGVIKDALVEITGKDGIFVYGISDKSVKGLDRQLSNGNLPVVAPAGVAKGAVVEFKGEESIGTGIRMHHKFVVIDFEKPTARVYMGSYNFSDPADLSNGENLWMFQDRRIAVAYMIEAVAMFDHYEWRDALDKSTAKGEKLQLATPPGQGKDAWWEEDYTVSEKIRDRTIFST